MPGALYKNRPPSESNVFGSATIGLQEAYAEVRVRSDFARRRLPVVVLTRSSRRGEILNWVPSATAMVATSSRYAEARRGELAALFCNAHRLCGRPTEISPKALPRVSRFVLSLS